MLSSPASGNYLFHEGTVTSVYLGQINRERIVTSPPFCLCLGRCFSLPQRRSGGPTAKPRSRFHSALPADAALEPLPAQQIPSSQPPAPRIAAAPTKIQHPLFPAQEGRFAAELRPGMAVLQLAHSFF